MTPQRPLPRGTHGQMSGEKVRDTYDERNTKFCGTGGRRKALSKERSSFDEGKPSKGLEGRMDISDREGVGMKLLKMKMTDEFYLTV